MAGIILPCCMESCRSDQKWCSEGTLQLLDSSQCLFLVSRYFGLGVVCTTCQWSARFIASFVTEVIRTDSTNIAPMPFQQLPSLVSLLLTLPILTPSSSLILGCQPKSHSPGMCFLTLCTPISALTLHTISVPPPPPLISFSFHSPLSCHCMLPTALCAAKHNYSFSWQRERMLLRCWPRCRASSSPLRAMKAEGCTVI